MSLYIKRVRLSDIWDNGITNIVIYNYFREILTQSIGYDILLQNFGGGFIVFSKINTFVISGARAFAVTVEADISRGIPDFEVVGLGSEAVREARKRVRAAIVNQGFSFPQSRVVLNLAPADIRKHGTSLDLPIAIGILSSAGVLPVYAAEKFSIIGELSLSGVIRPVKGIFSMVACGVKNGVKNFIVPYDNAEEAALAEGAAVYPVKSLAEAVRLLKGGPEDLPEGFLNGKNSYAYDQIGGNIVDNICDEYEKYGDFSDVAGQNGAKRALEIAASGGHNILLLGSPGSGKTMLAERLGGIMPPMSFEELFEVLQIYSAAGMLDSFGHIWHRPFRKVSSGVTRAAL